MGDLMANGDSRGERLQIMLSGAELTVLDDFRFKKRMPSRAAAIRELLKRGLAAEGWQAAAFGAKSEDFGVTGKTPPGREKK
jgi:metal-responsive CopG/Arc/MetJ family transcriptional regulator